MRAGRGGRCGWNMQIHYHIKDQPYYRCMHQYMTSTEKTCFGITGNVLDELVSGQVLRVGAGCS